MESLYFLIPIALIFVAVAVKVLFWAIKSGQYEDLDTEAHRILFDDDHPPVQKKSSGSGGGRKQPSPEKEKNKYQ